MEALTSGCPRGFKIWVCVLIHVLQFFLSRYLIFLFLLDLFDLSVCGAFDPFKSCKDACLHYFLSESASHEHEESGRILFLGKNYVLAHNLKFPMFG